MIAVSVTKNLRAQIARHLLGPRLARVGLERVVLALEHVFDAGEAKLRHQRGGHPVARAHAGEIERLLDVFEVALPAPHAGHLLNRVRQRVAHALLIEARHRRRGGDRAHRGADAFGGAMRRAHVIRSEREQPSAAQVVAERDRANQILSRALAAFAHGQGSGHDRAAGVGLGDRLEVVGLVGMPEHAVDERRVDRRGPDRRRQDRGFRHTALRPRETDRRFTRLEARARDHRRNRVEDAVTRLARDLGRQRTIARGRHVASHAAGEVS